MSHFLNGRTMVNTIKRAAQNAAGGRGTLDVKRNVDLEAREHTLDAAAVKFDVTIPEAIQFGYENWPPLLSRSMAFVPGKRRLNSSKKSSQS